MRTIQALIQLAIVAVLWLCATAVVASCLFQEELNGFFLVVWGTVWCGITAMLRYSVGELKK